MEGRRREVETDSEAKAAQLVPNNDKIEQAKDKTNLNQWEHAGACH